MGRHAQPVRRGPSGTGPVEVVGWGLFTVALVVVALVWSGVAWPVVLGVGAVVIAGTGAVGLAMLLTPGRSAPPQDDGGPRLP